MLFTANHRRIFGNIENNHRIFTSVIILSKTETKTNEKTNEKNTR